MTLTDLIPDNEDELLRLAANLLYEPDDQRRTPWPNTATLGIIRSRLRGIADGLEEQARPNPERPSVEEAMAEIADYDADALRLIIRNTLRELWGETSGEGR